MEHILTVILIIIVVIAVTPLSIFLKRKGYFDNTDPETIIKVIQVVSLISESLKLSDIVKKQADLVLDIAKLAVEFAEKEFQEDNIEKKKKIAMDAVYDVFKKLEITPTLSEQKLIEICIDETLKYYEKHPMKV